MPESTTNPISDLAQALGRVPSGLFILTARHAGKATGLLASWVQQAGFDPPAVTVAIRGDRFVGDWVVGSGRFVLNQVAADNRTLLKQFGKGFGPDDDAFSNTPLLEYDDPDAPPMLADALAYLDAEVVGEIASGDHRIILGKVVRGALVGDAREPYVHTRKNGLNY